MCHIYLKWMAGGGTSFPNFSLLPNLGRLCLKAQVKFLSPAWCEIEYMTTGPAGTPAAHCASAAPCDVLSVTMLTTFAHGAQRHYHKVASQARMSGTGFTNMQS